MYSPTGDSCFVMVSLLSTGMHTYYAFRRASHSPTGLNCAAFSEPRIPSRILCTSFFVKSCRHHTKSIMPPTCSHGCTKRASFGVEGTKKVEFCKDHAQDGMVDLVNKRCARQGCSTRASFGVEGTKKVEFCGEHAQDGIVHLNSKRCAQRGCNK